MSSDVERIILQGYKNGKRRFGDLGLHFEIYSDQSRSIICRHTRQLSSPEDRTVFAKSLHSSDLYLALACAREIASQNMADKTIHSCVARQKFKTEYGRFIEELTRFFSTKISMDATLADRVMADLFMPNDSGNSPFLFYDGRSSLCTWIRVMMASRMLRLQRSAVRDHAGPFKSESLASHVQRTNF